MVDYQRYVCYDTLIVCGFPRSVLSVTDQCYLLSLLCNRVLTFSDSSKLHKVFPFNIEMFKTVYNIKHNYKVSIWCDNSNL